jgi:hypothetical protein
MAKSGAMDQSKAKALVAPVTSNVEVCSNWWVQYTDGGYGEDYFATDWWAHQQAKYAYAQIWDTSWNFYWDGNLTRTGCTYVSLPPGTYYLFEYSAYAASDTLSFNSYYWTSSGWATYAYESFDVYSNTNWVNVYPWGNDDATQVAAINGLVMDQDGMLANSLGLTAHWPYDVRTNWYCSSCGGGSHAYFQPPTSSAPNGYVGVGNHGVGGGDTEPHWKFMVTHELGHYAQFISMGLHDYSYSVSTNYDALCTCDHYDATLGNTLHCMQSYEDIGGAELEGFAHGFASRVYNYPYDWNASFTYYKPFLDDWSTFWFAPVAFDSFTSAQWLENHCVDSAAGVEMDWMAFYYSVTTELFSGSLTMQDLFSIYRRTCTGDPGVVCAGQTVYWWDLDWAAYVHYGYNAMDPHYLHFADTGYYAGVAH